MKKIFILILMSVFILTSCQNNISQEKENLDSSYEKEYAHEEGHDYNLDFTNYEKSNLTQKEIDAIIYMREEEKLARDVYRTLYKTTPSNVFHHIPKSEEEHMAAFKQLIQRYNLEDPIKNENNIGTYKNEKFTELFKELTTKGKENDLEAFKVGALVEDINMFNLMKFGKETDKEDLKYVYESLLWKSKSHMGAFLRQLSKYNYKYVPQYISQDDLNKINS